jgi:hypothetical protein
MHVISWHTEDYRTIFRSEKAKLINAVVKRSKAGTEGLTLRRTSTPCSNAAAAKLSTYVHIDQQYSANKQEVYINNEMRHA